MWYETSSKQFQYVVLTRFWGKNCFFSIGPQRSSEVTSWPYTSTANKPYTDKKITHRSRVNTQIKCKSTQKHARRRLLKDVNIIHIDENSCFMGKYIYTSRMFHFTSETDVFLPSAGIFTHARRVNLTGAYTSCVFILTSQTDVFLAATGKFTHVGCVQRRAITRGLLNSHMHVRLTRPLEQDFQVTGSCDGSAEACAAGFLCCCHSCVLSASFCRHKLADTSLDHQFRKYDIWSVDVEISLLLFFISSAVSGMPHRGR